MLGKTALILSAVPAIGFGLSKAFC